MGGSSTGYLRFICAWELGDPGSSAGSWWVVLCCSTHINPQKGEQRLFVALGQEPAKRFPCSISFNLPHTPGTPHTLILLRKTASGPRTRIHS